MQHHAGFRKPFWLRLQSYGLFGSAKRLNSIAAQMQLAEKIYYSIAILCKEDAQGANKAIGGDKKRMKVSDLTSAA